LKRSKTGRSINSNIAKIAFIIFLYFTFFGTTLPFREKVTNVDDIVTSNILNQVVYGLLLLISAPILLKKSDKLILIIKKEKYLSLFLLWCLLSIFWSEFSIVSLKRLIRIFSIITVILAILFYLEESEEVLKYIKYILYIYIPISLLSVLFIPQAIDPQFGSWRGLADGKNQLGQVSLVSTIIWFYAMRLDKSKTKFAPFSMLIGSLILLLGSQSSTSIITFLVLIFFGMLLYLDNLFKTVGFGRTFFVITILAFMVIIVSTFYLAPEILNSMPNYFGKDSTFTGRTFLWTDIFNEAKKHLLFGCGFEGFWLVENLNLTVLYEIYLWLPRQAHNGYLDILNETGFVGLLLFILIPAFYIKNLLKFKKPPFGAWLVIATLIINFQETTLFRAGSLTGALFILSYLILYTRLIQQEQFNS